MLKLADAASGTASPNTNNYYTVDTVKSGLADVITRTYKENRDVLDTYILDPSTKVYDYVTGDNATNVNAFDKLIRDPKGREDLVAALIEFAMNAKNFNIDDPNSAAARGAVLNIAKRLDYADPDPEYDTKLTTTLNQDIPAQPYNSDRIRSYDDLMNFQKSYKKQLKSYFKPGSNYANAVSWSTNNYLNKRLEGMSAWQKIWIGIQKFLAGLGFELPKDWSYSKLLSDVSNYGKNLVTRDLTDSSYGSTIDAYNKQMQSSKGKPVQVRDEISKQIDKYFAMARDNYLGEKPNNLATNTISNNKLPSTSTNVPSQSTNGSAQTPSVASDTGSPSTNTQTSKAS